MSYLRTSRRRREREAKRQASSAALLKQLTRAGIAPPGFNGTVVDVRIPWERLGVTRAEAGEAFGFDPDGDDDQVTLLDPDTFEPTAAE